MFHEIFFFHMLNHTKILFSQAGEMAQNLRECTALAKDLPLVPSLHNRKFTIACHSSSRESEASGLWAPTLT